MHAMIPHNVEGHAQDERVPETSDDLDRLWQMVPRMMSKLMDHWRRKSLHK
jgi:hypothetical protein